MSEIDFVVLWVDDTDPEWQKSKAEYSEENTVAGLNQINRYRDWGIFHYWFRGVEKYAPWVRKIHLVTAGHLPKWLNTEHPKLNIVRHDEFMDKRYLPTFSVRPIELNLHRIPGLAEKFVYFNDDMFIINSVKPEYFFQKGLPTDMGVRNVISGNDYSTVLYNNLRVIERNVGHINPIKDKPLNWFNIKYGKALIRNILLSPWKSHLGFYSFHRPTSYLKSDFEKVWAAEGAHLDKTCLNKFRTTSDINHQVFRWWRLVENNFHPFSFSNIAHDIPLGSDSGVTSIIKKQKYPLVCLNDNEYTNFSLIKPHLKKIMGILFPHPSRFEKN